MEQIAGDVYWLPLGRGWQAVNVYLVGSRERWCLVDAGWAGNAPDIRRAAAGLFGAGSRPDAILLTHCHPDHAGAARVLALDWGCAVWMHPLDLPLARPDVAAVRECGGPLDRWVILPVLRLLGPARRRAVMEKDSLGDLARGLDADSPPPGAPGWTALHTPGHTPGHIALVREDDGVAITGDALVTTELNAPLGMLRGRRVLGLPPWITTWDWTAAGASAETLARSGPRVIAPGHGRPASGAEAGQLLDAFLTRRARRHATQAGAPAAPPR